MVDLKKLNPEQRKAVEHFTGPALVIAGAGSGKTLVLATRLALLIEKGVDPSVILALTFTNKAANEMKKRVKTLIGTKADSVWMGTFHSVFAKILRMEAAEIGFTSDFSIYDTEDSRSAVSNIMEELNISTDSFNPNHIRAKISFYKNQMIDAEEFAAKHINSPLDEKTAKVYAVYGKRLKENNAMDFDDLLLQPIELFKQNKKILAKYRKRFEYCMVDEFQDTNKAQYELMKLLATKEGNLFAVGDDAQSIYSWRGANIGNILSFEKDFPKAALYKLQQNYRSTKMILGAADSVIKHNTKQIPKTLWTNNEEGEPVTLLKCSDEKDEAYQVADFIKHDIQNMKLSYSDFCILYRTNTQSRAFEDVFHIGNIPYRIVGGIEFYKRKEIKDLLAYLRVLTNSKDEESLLRVMNFPQRGIGMTTIKRMVAFARKHNISLYDTMGRVFEVIDIKERIQKNVKNFRELLTDFINLKLSLSPGELTRTLVDKLSLIKLYKEEGTVEGLEVVENITQLLISIDQFCEEYPGATIEDYLQRVSLVTDLEMIDEKHNAVTLMTVHAAKGLEFPVVFITGLEEEIFPISNKFESESSLEEERRLFYVALTRAEKKAYMSHARGRYRFGEVAYQERSRFIEEMEPDWYAVPGPNGPKKSGRLSKRDIIKAQFEGQEYIEGTTLGNHLRVGIRVFHEKFGIGRVQQLVGSRENQKVTVIFEGNNVKQLMLKFAKLKIHQ